MRIKSCSFLVLVHQSLDMKSNIDKKLSLPRSTWLDASHLKMKSELTGCDEVQMDRVSINEIIPLLERKH